MFLPVCGAWSLELVHIGGGSGRGKVGWGGFDGVEAQVQASLVGKYSMVFSGDQSLSNAHFLKKIGQLGEVLGWANPRPQDTHEGVPSLAQLLVMWLSLEQLAHLTIPGQASRV